ncbi:hypothetical protein Back2_17980 [Nocardioides baekrokdamisoli]|uniref:F5/8 type C domain-containing protein n=1 Tax=Nocardioides baekrokdamisoli TaxID=1804624 RepID=A0A3G9IV22_9ACTN|nr:hypothetical protein [Nocardioides baekrokdamisoli]BBH17511.1 hypothetical protein Back2_17980 [Nocardioides baekrokdamisoli]
MTWAFPYGAAASAANPTLNAATGVYYADQNPVIRVTPARQTVTRIEVRDWYDNVVTSLPFVAGRVVSGDEYSATTTPGTMYAIPAPSGGWKPGWYRLYQYDDINTADVGAYGTWNGGVAVGATNIVILRTQLASFPPFDPTVHPADWTVPTTGSQGTTDFLTALFPTGAPGLGGGSINLRLRAAIGASTARLTMDSALDFKGGAYHVTQKQITGNVATLTLGEAHTLQVGAAMGAYGIGAPFTDGAYTITAKTSTTVSFALTAADLVATAGSGYVYSSQSDALVNNRIQQAISNEVYTVPNTSPHYDPARSALRQTWVEFPNLAVDFLQVIVGGAGFNVLPADPSRDPATYRVVVTAGTVSGFKIVVTQADGVTPIETYDNVADIAHAQAAINWVSAYIWLNGPELVNTPAPVQVPNAAYLGVRATVAALTSLGLDRFEGPVNEPSPQPQFITDNLKVWQLFHKAVKDENSSAKVLGPGYVELFGVNPLDPTDTPASCWFGQLLAAGFADYVDEWSTHIYNVQPGGDFNVARALIQGWFDVLDHFGVNDRPVWVTEGLNPEHIIHNGGVWSPRFGREMTLQTLLWEQFGVPRERAVLWYDISHGFWDYPTWMLDADQTWEPGMVLMRVLAEETWGKLHHTAMSFGPIGDRIFLGSVYRNPSDLTSVAVMQAQSSLQVDGGSSVTLEVSDSTVLDLEVVNGLGHQSTLERDVHGYFRVPVEDIPTYVHLPAHVTATVVTCNDWPHTMSALINSASAASGVVPTGRTGGVFVKAINDDQWELYPVQSTQPGSVYWADTANSGTTLPDTVTLDWPRLTRVDRVIVWSGNLSLNQNALSDFDVQTSMDGTTWTTRATVAREATCRQWSTDSSSHGCRYETYWSRQWIHDVKFPDGPVYAKYVRLYVRHTSHGELPDATGLSYVADPFKPSVVLQEVAVLCDRNAQPTYATLT